MGAGKLRDALMRAVSLRCNSLAVAFGTDAYNCGIHVHLMYATVRGHFSEPDRRTQRCGWYVLESGQAPLVARSSAARRRVLVRA